MPFALLKLVLPSPPPPHTGRSHRVSGGGRVFFPQGPHWLSAALVPESIKIRNGQFNQNEILLKVHVQKIKARILSKTAEDKVGKFLEIKLAP